MKAVAVFATLATAGGFPTKPGAIAPPKLDSSPEDALELARHTIAVANNGGRNDPAVLSPSSTYNLGLDQILPTGTPTAEPTCDDASPLDRAIEAALPGVIDRAKLAVGGAPEVLHQVAHLAFDTVVYFWKQHQAPADIPEQPKPVNSLPPTGARETLQDHLPKLKQGDVIADGDARLTSALRDLQASANQTSPNNSTT